MKRHTLALLLLIASVAVGKGRNDINFIFVPLAGVAVLGDYYVSESPLSGQGEGHAVLDVREGTFRGKLKGEVTNDSGKSAVFVNEPAHHELLHAALLTDLGPTNEISQSKYKVSKKGKARGTFRGTYSISG